MSELISLSKELREELDKLPLFKEYHRVRSLFEASKEIKDLKRDIVRAKNENRMDDYNLLKEKYDNHPLIQNYLSLQKEVEEYLKEVSDIINK